MNPIKRMAIICMGVILTMTGMQNLNATEYRGVMSPGGFVTEEDYKTLHEWNANLIRKQFVRNWGKIDTDTDIAEYEAWILQKCGEVDRELALADKYGVKVILDLHTPPGGRMAQDKLMRMFYEQKYADEFIKTWKMLATRYKGDRRILAFDLINEPTTTSDAPISYWDLQLRAAKAIRAIDPGRTIVFACDGWDGPGGFANLKPIKMDNVIYQAHMYIPMSFTHQRVFNSEAPEHAYPGEFDHRVWNREALAKELEPVRKFQLENNVRIYIGEFSAIAWAPGAERYIADCISLFEEYGWDWSYHAFREWSGWSVEHTGDPTRTFKPSADNPRKRALLDGFRKNKEMKHTQGKGE